MTIIIGNIVVDEGGTQGVGRGPGVKYTVCNKRMSHITRGGGSDN